MYYEHPIYTRLKKEIEFRTVKYNRKRIFNRAIYIMSSTGLSWSESLKQSWSETKKVVLKHREEVAKMNDKLLNLFTPVQYKFTHEYQEKRKHELFNKGLIKNI